MFLDAINLTILGMGFVFAFLTVMVFSTKLMSLIALQISTAGTTTEKKAINTHPASELGHIDEDTQLIITQAIKQHIRR